MEWETLVYHYSQRLRIESDMQTEYQNPSIVLLYKLLFSRVRPSRKFPLQCMSIYSNDNISKIAKLTPRELPHLVQNRENNGLYSMSFKSNA